MASLFIVISKYIIKYPPPPSKSRWKSNENVDLNEKT